LILGKNKNKIIYNNVIKRDESQIEFLKLGGNRRFKDFLKQYNVPENAMSEYKYMIRASDYYRNLLKSEVKKTNPTIEKPDLLKGLEMLYSNNTNTNEEKSKIIY